jgi:hypothetical protein
MTSSASACLTVVREVPYERASSRSGGTGLLGGLLVHRFAELHRSLRQRVRLGRDRIRIAALEGFLQVGDGILYRAAVGVADFRAMLGQRLLGRVDQRLGVVLGLDLRFALLVFFGVRLGVLDHLLNVGLG